LKSILSLIRRVKAAPFESLSRTSRSLAAREQLDEDFFGDWIPEEVELFKRYAVGLKGTAGCITDFPGVKTRGSLVPWVAHMEGMCISVEQNVAVRKEAELDTPVVELIRKVSISEQTFYRWKKVYGTGAVTGAQAQADGRRERQAETPDGRSVAEGLIKE
jgi:hypothetical protein